MNKKQIISWILVFIWMGVIFMFSAQDGDSSGDLSGTFTDVLLAVLSFLHIETADVGFLSIVVRKLAHMFIYFVLALFVINAFGNHKLNPNSIRLFTLLVCFLYACSDEFHQSFSPGRAMLFTDVLIDTAGAFLGILAFFILNLFLRQPFSSRV